MSVRFIGNTEFEPTATQPPWTVNGYGLDAARITWRGAATRRKAFEDKLKKFAAMPNFPGMRLDSWSSNDDPVFPIVELSYIGLRSGVASVPKIADSRAVHTVSTNYTNPDGLKFSAEFSYYAPRTNYAWVETSNPPLDPRYSAVRKDFNPILTIFRRSITQDGAKRTISTADFTGITNTLIVQKAVSDYVIEEVIPNAIWLCECSIERQLIGV